MKKRILLLVMVLLFTLSLGTSALATRDYGVIYDETEMLGSEADAPAAHRDPRPRPEGGCADDDQRRHPR